MFEVKNRNYNFHHDFLIKRCKIRSVYYGTETASFIGPKIWGTLPNSCKDATLLKSFKVNLKKWIPGNCPCRLCKTYSTCRVQTCRVQRVSFKGSSKTQLNLRLRLRFLCVINLPTHLVSAYYVWSHIKSTTSILALIFTSILNMN